MSQSEFTNYMDHLQKVAFNNVVRFVGVVEDNLDPMTLGRVKVRAFHFHPEDRNDVPTEALPWAIVIQPTTSASISGIGWSPNGLEMGSWVTGYFADGEDAQYPIVDGVFPTIHRPNPPGQPGGASSGFFGDNKNYSSGDNPGEASRPYHGEPVENMQGGAGYAASPNIPPQGTGGSAESLPNGTAEGDGALAAHGDINMMLTKEHISKWNQLGLPTYSWKAAPDGYACKDGKASLKFHYGTALALEKLTKMFGKGKLSITSAYRSPEYNAALRRRGVNAAKNSQHTYGRALDIGLGKIGGQAEQARFAKMAAQCGFTGFGLYKSFIHIDTGNGRVWNGAKAAWFVKAIKEGGWYPGKPGLSGIKSNPGATTPDPEGTSSEATASDSTGNRDIVTRNDVKDYANEYLQKDGYSDVQRAAILANIQHESAFNPTASGDGGDAFGLFQWNDRRSKLINWSNAQGLDYRSTEAQMGFFSHEMKTSESRAGNALRNATTVAEANEAMARFERYQGYNQAGGEKARRLATAQQIYNGEFSGSNAPISKGFVDPTNSLPFAQYRGEPSTHMNARGLNSPSSPYTMSAQNTGRASGFPVAGDIGTMGEPDSQAAPQYPWNKTYGTKSGHIMEFDDTPGAERINIRHHNGSSIEIFANGNMSIRTSGDAFKVDRNNSYHMVQGKYMMTSVNDMHLRTTADMTVQADGSLTQLIGNDHTLVISGDVVIGAGGDVKIKGARVTIEGSSVDILSSGNLNLEAKGSLTLKGKSIQTEAADDFGIKAGGDIAADPGGAMRVAEGKAEGSKGAQSTDIGGIPERKVIDKSGSAVAATPTGDSVQHYAEKS